MVDNARVTFQNFDGDKNMEWFHDNLGRAKALFIVPQLLRGAFFIGGSGGSGAVLTQDQKTGEWSPPAFYTMSAGSIGLQFGGQASQIIMIVMTDKGLDSLMSTSFKLGGDVSVAAGPVGTGAKAKLADIYAFAISKGAFAGMSAEGSVIKPRDGWNEAFYGRPVRPVEILIEHKVTNEGADDLRATLKKASAESR
jgi:lipid-binding SYLF domain-containing protein